MDGKERTLLTKRKVSKSKKPRLSLHLNLGPSEATGYWSTVPQEEIITIRNVLGKNLSLTLQRDVLNSVRLKRYTLFTTWLLNNSSVASSTEITKR